MNKETLEEVELAILFHNTYERLAPSFGYETRVDTKLFETTTPNGQLMIAVCKVILQSLSPKHPEDGWVRVDTLPTQNGKYLIWDNGWDKAYYKDGKWISTQPTLKSTSPLLQSRFRQELHPTHWQPLPNKPNQTETEAEKDGDKFIRDNMALPIYLPLDSFAPSMRLSYDLAFKSYLEGYSLARKQAIEDVLEFARYCKHHTIPSIVITEELYFLYINKKPNL